MKKKQSKTAYKFYFYGALVCLVAVIVITYIYGFSSFSKSEKTEYVYIDEDDNIDSVYHKLAPIARAIPMQAFRTLTHHSEYAEHIRTGRYAIHPGDGSLKTWRHLKNGLQEPVNLTGPSVRTLDKLAAELGRKLMLDSATICHALTDEATCEKYGYDTATIACMFIPNTYDIYWNVSLDKLLSRMKKESDKFWNFERTQKAKNMNLTPQQVITLASIVDEETANDGEKPMIAGMYYNRLMLRNAEYPEGMPLQADPTIKFAWKRFELKRIYNNLLSIRSPYNTYRNPGLPPGPIRIPTGCRHRCRAQPHPPRLSLHVCEGGFQRHPQLCPHLLRAPRQRSQILKGTQRERNQINNHPLTSLNKLSKTQQPLTSAR